MEHDAWFFIGIFVFIFLIWIATGGPTHPIAFTGIHLAEPGALGGGTYLRLPTSSSASSTATTTCLPGSTNCANPYRGPGLPSSGVGNRYTYVCLPGSTTCANSYSYGTTGTGGSGITGLTPISSGVPGVALTPPSSYRNIVSMNSYVSNASSSDPKSEYVQIYVSQNASTAVDITNWVLESGATGKAEIIPKGTAVPASGVVNASSDIILEPGDRAIIISGESPVGASFRESKCIGYFGGFQRFTPSLPTNCPSASDELSSLYGTPYIHDPSCIDYAKSLPRCETPVTGTSKLSLTCQDFLESHLSYNGCLSLHRNDSDFNGTTWRIYLGRKSLQDATQSSRLNQDAGPLWRSRYEVVELLDDRGKTVATFNY